VICAAREHPIERESPAVGICQDCFGKLPRFMQEQYESGALTIRQITSAAQNRNTTATQLRAGRHTSDIHREMIRSTHRK
jgi:hypothetical protein